MSRHLIGRGRRRVIQPRFLTKTLEDEGFRFDHERADGAEVFADDLHLVQLNAQSADLLLQVVAALPPLLRIRVQFAAAVHLLATIQVNSYKQL